MSDIDERRERLKFHLEGDIQLSLTELSEADVRVKLVDPLFVDALGWPEGQIRRERQTTAGEYIDYECGLPNTFFVVEAKRCAAQFKFPDTTHRRTYQLSGLLQRDQELKKACEQVARYCQDEGITYAVIANGTQLIIFKAMRTDRPWRKGHALVYRSANELIAQFDELWDVLSFPAVRGRSLDKFFAPPDETPRHRKSVIATIANPDEKLVRNALNSQLVPVIRAVFDDLTEPAHASVLEHCYVHSRQLQAVADDFILTIRDLPPKYLAGQVDQVITSNRSGLGLRS